jgi:glycolate oxidase iron-sulfur subunit
VYLSTGREADAARGKLALLEGLADRMFEAPTGVMERLGRCLMCGACAQRCPVGVEPLELFARARFIVKETMGLSPVQRLALQQILAVPHRCNRIIGVVAGAMRRLPGARRQINDSSVPRRGPLPQRPRYFVPPAAESFLDALRRHGTPGPGSSTGTGPRVALFAGCLLDKLFPSVAHSLLRTLASSASHIILPQDQGCCGMPAVSAGDLSTFTRLVRHHVRLFSREPFDYLVTACATCSSTIRTLWPKLCPLQSRALGSEAVRISEKTMDITEFLCHISGFRQPRQAGIAPIPVTYHDPCHLKKSLGVSREPRTLIQADPRYRLVEMQGADTCCGMGGSFALRHAGIAMQIGARKREQIAATGAAIVATACPACMIQLKELLATHTPAIQVRHILEL